MNNHYKGKFIGPRRIKELKLIDEKTLLGQEIYLVSYRDGTQEELPKQVIKDTATDKAKDLTELRELRVKPVVAKIIGLLTEADLKLEEIDYMGSKVSSSIEEAIKQTVTKLWGKEFSERTMRQLDKTLKEL